MVRLTFFDVLRAALAILLVIIAVRMCTTPAPAYADDYIAITTTSYHFNREKDYNEKNFGIGAERSYAADWRGHAGAYRNSLDRATIYALASYTPYRLGKWQVGGAGGLGTGYNSRPVGVLVGGFAIREWRNGFGVNVIVHPAAVALQVKMKF